MKPYLTRLAQRAAAPREMMPVVRAPVSDPFAAPAEPDVSSTDAILTGSGPHRKAGVGHEMLRPPTTREQPIAPPIPNELPTKSHTPLSPALPSPALTPATAHPPKDRDEEVKPREQRATSEPLSDIPDRSLDTAEDRIRSMLPPASRDPVSLISRTPERDNENGRPTANDSETQKPATPLPLESDLLRLADCFMEELQRGMPAPPEADEPERNEPPPLLPPRQPELHGQKMRAAAADPAPTSTVHIGSLRVEVISPPTAPAGAMRSPAPKVIRRGGARPFGRGIVARQQFGLRQL